VVSSNSNRSPLAFWNTPILLFRFQNMKQCLTAEISIYQSAQTIDALKQQILDTNTKAAQQVQVIVKQVEAVKTPTQAVAAMPDVSSLPVAIRPLPNSQDFLLPQVDVVPLFQQLAEGKKCAIELSACETNFAAGKQIVDQKDSQIAALTKKPGFFHRVGTIMKQVGVGVVIGIVLGRRF
jgi:hypothetical protein